MAEINRETLEKLLRDVERLKCKVANLPTTDIYVDGGSYDPDTMTLILTDNDGITPDVVIDLSALASDTLYSADGIVGTGRIATVTDTLTFTGPAGMFILKDGTEGTPGYIWTSINANGAGAWVPSPTASTNIYNSDGSISDAIRNVIIDEQLVFFGGDIGIGTSAIASTKLTVQAYGSQTEGTIITTANITPTDKIFQVRDAGNINAITVLVNRTTLVDQRLIIGTVLGSVSSSATLVTKGSDSLFLTRNTELTDGSNTRLWEVRNDGHIGHNANATVGDRLFMVAGAGLDGAINISAFNLANNGYGILIQGGSGGASYSGILCDANGGSTGINRAGFFGAGVSGPQENHGIYSGSRNGSVYSISLYGVAQGGDSVNPSEFAAAVWAQVMTQQADDRRAINATITQAGNVNNSVSYGMKFEIGYVSLVANEAVWGLNVNCSATGAGVVNTAAYFVAAGVGAVNNAIIVPANSGYIILGASANINASLLEVSGDIEVIGNVSGLILEDRTAGTRHRVYFNGGNLNFEAA